MEGMLSMKAIAQAEIIALISDINAFADKAEALITSTKENYARQKNTMYLSLIHI